MRQGVVFEIQHFTVHDGPGIRTTVFLKGCQLKCLWCHNPESIRVNAGELSFVSSKCVGCGQCFRVCPNGAHRMEHDKHIINRENCTACGVCVDHCVGGALTVSGKPMTVEQVMEEVRKDLTYYRESGGGITLSGGEPMMQREFVKELLESCREQQISTALETNLCYPYEWLDGIREKVDLFLADWKESDSQRHMEYTGSGNEQILENLRKLSKEGNRILLRCPIIPGYNDRLDHFKTIARLTKELPLQGAELLPYHNMGVGKIEKFGLNGKIKYIKLEEPSKETVNEWIDTCIYYGGNIINMRS